MFCEAFGPLFNFNLFLLDVVLMLFIYFLYLYFKFFTFYLEQPYSSPLAMKILETNLNRSRTAHDLAFLSAMKEGADLIVACEPNLALIRKDGWIVDLRNDVAVYFLNKNIPIAEIKKKMGSIRLTLETFSIICEYVSPNIDLTSFETFLSTMSELTNVEDSMIVLGDFNAKAAEWGSPIQDKKREILMEWFTALDLVVQNTRAPTFIRGNSFSHIDITSSSQRIAHKVKNWKVLPDEGVTDHQHIIFEVTTEPISRHSHHPRLLLDRVLLRRELEYQISILPNDKVSLAQCQNVLKSVCKKCLPRGQQKNLRRPY